MPSKRVKRGAPRLVLKRRGLGSHPTCLAWVVYRTMMFVVCTAPLRASALHTVSCAPCTIPYGAHADISHTAMNGLVMPLPTFVRMSRTTCAWSPRS